MTTNTEKPNGITEATDGGLLSPPPCSQFSFDQDEYEKLVTLHGEQNVETGGEDFCPPWWDAKRQCWCVSARYADCGLRQYADGWEWALIGIKYPTALEAYEHRNDEFLSANAAAQREFVGADGCKNTTEES